MKKNSLLIILAITIIFFAVGMITVVLFPFQHQPDRFSRFDDKKSTQQGIQEVVNANNKFAFDLYSKLSRSGSGNIFYSPYSISAALAMTYEGAKGQTAEEIKSVFHFPEHSVLRENFSAIYNEINKKDSLYELSNANALWAQQDYRFLDEYLATIERYYRGRAVNLDFEKDIEKSRQIINDFIKKQTANRIEDLIPQGVLDVATKLVLTNAIYFRGTWFWEFDKSDTREQDFKITPTDVIRVPMMQISNEKAKFNYADVGDLQILELPYKGDKISMFVLLPTDTLDTIELNLNIEKFEEWKSKMRGEKLAAIFLPKFELNTKYSMKNTLKDMGMPSAFSAGVADFSGMDGTRSLFIGQVIHQAFIKVDEEGTEAAGATAVIMKEGIASERKIFNADHPFIFIIQEKATGDILFLGRVSDPTK